MKHSIFVIFCLSYVFFLKAQGTIQQADELYAIGNYTKAIETYKSSGEVSSVYYKIAKSYVAIGNYGEAINYYKKAITANPENNLFRYDYAKLLKRTKKFEESKQIVQQLIAIDSLNPNFQYELGLILEKQSDTLAIAAFRKVYNLDPLHQKAIFKIAKKYIIKGKYDDAQKLIDQGLESYSNNVELISLKAQAYYFQEYYTHAVVWFNKLIDLGESSEFIHEKLSLSYAQNSDYKDAIFHRKEALKYNPYDANAIFVIGSYYERLADYQNAEVYYRKALEVQDVSLSNEYQKLGRVLNLQKKYDEAIIAFQRSLHEDPDDFMSEFYLIRTKEAYYADKDAVIKLYESFLKKHKDNPISVYAKQQLDNLKKERFFQKK